MQYLGIASLKKSVGPSSELTKLSEMLHVSH